MEEGRCVTELMSGAIVYHHQEKSWNGVSSDKFGVQTAIRIGKGGLNGMTLSPDMVAEWIDSFPVTAYISDTMDHLTKRVKIVEKAIFDLEMIFFRLLAVRQQSQTHWHQSSSMNCALFTCG